MFGAQDSTTILAASILLGIGASGLSAALSYYLTRKRQIEADQRRLRQDHYLKYIRALSANVTTGGRASAVAETARAYNELLLVAVPEVVRAAQAFAAHIDVANPMRSAEPQRFLAQHNQLLGELVRSMRHDLFGREKALGNELDSVAFQTMPEFARAPEPVAEPAE